MPRVYVATTTADITVLYSVDRAVGPGRANDRNDVLLVQFLLNAAAKPSGGLPGIQPAGQGPLMVDGVFGSKTAAYIRHYQAAGQGKTTVDGVVSPVEEGSLIGSLHGKVITIAHLNGSYAKRFGVQAHLRLDLDPAFPPALRPALFV